MKKKPNTVNRKVKPRKSKADNTLMHKRKLGAYGETIKIADDFNAPLPEEILRAFEGEFDPEEETQRKK